MRSSVVWCCGWCCFACGGDEVLTSRVLRRLNAGASGLSLDSGNFVVGGALIEPRPPLVVIS
jgi:hypothetical protein